ncbi:MAG: NAD(P)H-dependent FMN reductase [Chroococcopsis gigantea SAG 12.99]|jgi:chromate reductase|nr:NAD(P)H-dependent oxidoreductase [Chlorogloea purpurea SAG 13.99]MDV3002203.1 NAD(P)H-dependent FMN reductase [Chroococcopsis gigantea SAG 12.99]
MSDAVKILAFAGSARLDSFNKKLVKIAAAGARDAGAEVTFLDFRDLPMPLFDEDLESQSGLPANVLQFKKLLKTHDGFLIACPEYNSSITPLLKNAIDWASRPEPEGNPLAHISPFRGKTAAIMSASPGALGGLRGLVHVRAILGNIGVLVIPDQRAVGNASQSFDDTGNLKDNEQRNAIRDIGVKLATITTKLAT